MVECDHWADDLEVEKRGQKEDYEGMEKSLDWLVKYTQHNCIRQLSLLNLNLKVEGSNFLKEVFDRVIQY